jgi:hypothetical protein
MVISLPVEEKAAGLQAESSHQQAENAKTSTTFTHRQYQGRKSKPGIKPNTWTPGLHHSSLPLGDLCVVSDFKFLVVRGSVHHPG